MTTAALRRRFIQAQVRRRLYWITKEPHDSPIAARCRAELRELRVQHTGLIALENAANAVIREMHECL